MPDTQYVRFQSGDLLLEGTLSLPPSSPVGCAVVCHPYPPYGGSMDNNVVHAIAGALSAAAFAVLKFNFRGVGRSQGAFADGRFDAGDIGAAIEFLLDNLDDSAPPLWLCGYSYGSARAVEVATPYADLAGVALVSPPVELFDCGAIASVNAPLLALAGTEDPYCDLAALKTLVDANPRARLELAPGADHFWMGREAVIRRAIRRFVDDSRSSGGD